MQQKDWQRLLDTQQRLLILLPKDVAELRDRGLAYAHLECPQAALEDLETYLDQRPYAMDVAKVRAMLPALRMASKKLN
jgi:regulator of sirC expression with transglutaminase-like and TPR domain